MATQFRLLASHGQDARSVCFQLVWPAPSGQQDDAALLAASLETGDGQTLELGMLPAPSVCSWREQRKVRLACHTYEGPGPFRACLRRGDTAAENTFTLPLPGQGSGEPGGAVGSATKPPEVILFAVDGVQGRPLQQVARVRVGGLASGQRLRIDGGAGQVFWLDGPGRGTTPATATILSHEWTLSYSKPGDYVVGLDVVDADGYWLATLGETPVQVAEPIREPGPQAAARATDVPLVVTAVSGGEPWLPYRYARPAWGWSRAFTEPGEGKISRLLGSGICLSLRAETQVGDTIWYQTMGCDWVPANGVNVLKPSDLRGVQLGAPARPLQQTTPADPSRHGVTTTAVNVRALPGAQADNPPIDQLPAGAAVAILEEQDADGAAWYRIGDRRWVHSSYVRLTDGTTPSGPRRGRVTSASLNVRSRPGVSPANAVVAQLHGGDEVTLLEESVQGGTTWYRIGADRWVSGDWIKALDGSGGQAIEFGTLPIGWAVAPSVPVVTQPGQDPATRSVDQIEHNQSRPIAESKTLNGATWHRIGSDRWVEGTWFGVASAKPRPASIGADEYWVAVSLKDQTLVAYEGDRPIYAALVATGAGSTPTVQGIFRTWLRKGTTKMSGGNPGFGSYYYLEDVTWSTFFYKSYGLHAAYWHDAFGRPRSHGCVNLSPYDAWWIYRWGEAGGEQSPAVYVY